MPQEKDEQFNRLRSKANLEKERGKESTYKALFMDLLKEHRGILKNAMDADKSVTKNSNYDIDTSNNSTNKGNRFTESSRKNPQHYQAETKILKKVMEVERDAIVGALAVGVTAFVTVRFLPRVAIRVLGSEKKIKALQKSEEQLRKNRSTQAYLKSAGSFIFEGTIGFWAAYRGYHMAVSMRSVDVHDDIVNLPLCEGRSVVSDTICDEWSNIVKYKVPTDFWRNIDNTEKDSHLGGGRKIESDIQNKGLKDETFWKAVLKFEDSCTKRRAMEEAIRHYDGLNDVAPVVIPAPGVPDEILELSEDEVEKILSLIE